jgi:hypothetical protein
LHPGLCIVLTMICMLGEIWGYKLLGD